MRAAYTSGTAHLSYWDQGPGLPVVFLHPTPLDHDYWRPLTEQLSGIRAIIPDLRGHGASELGTDLPRGGFSLAPDAPVLSMAQYAADIIALLDHLQLDRAIFAGCSIGGYILLELWRQIPQRIQALAFICSKPQPDTPQGQAKRAENIAHARAEGVAALFDGMAKSLVGKTAQTTHPEIVAQVRSHMTLNTEALIAVQAGLATRPDSLPTVASITVPVLAIAGGEDPAVTAAEMEALKAAPGGCYFHLLADVGHFAAYEQPQQVAEIFLAWMRQRQLAQ
ncbi:alpha/beta fold hydrolase [Terracidiphilus gabretensis]|uniref:alpha/beta fold hydrolase n=1 Tax=Terracidiphilus gabretensis TaxID=1577687 RepID=UPI00071BDC56|nr:alpha/beta hydrolase [Terracidiphilus gabretensis]